MAWTADWQSQCPPSSRNTRPEPRNLPKTVDRRGNRGLVSLISRRRAKLKTHMIEGIRKFLRGLGLQNLTWSNLP